MASNRIVIIGAGVMGQGIAEAVAAAGFEAILIDLNIEIVKRSLDKISGSLNRAIGRWALTQSDKKAILARIIPSDDLQIAKEASIVIESIPENLVSKQELLKKLDLICPPETIFITNTATLSVTALGTITKRPDRIIGLHFLCPVPAVPLVEIIQSQDTSPETYRKVCEFAHNLGKTAIPVREYPGYITTRIMVPLINEAMYVLMEGISTAEDIDRAMRLGYGFNIGPLSLADIMGLDVLISYMD
ncbi:MAG: 3-hydroxyacyl-CoA dehydrogenase NAD-binding domain-containing protein, partial [candidate division Zixibacteria bacterium]|nr:3-hydroxyacyl-CoA dehydrogenase NAD-binding domain-containing protein [candidate division Zixibacteria bacterium]